MAKQGVNTGAFGKWVSEYLTSLAAYAGYKVYYDHGDTTVESNVVATKGIFGDKATNLTRLADVDVIIVKPDDTIRLLFEIEERPVSPKKILGNVLACLLCNRFAVKVSDNTRTKKKKQKYFGIADDTVLLVAGVVPTSGARLKKICDTIQPRMHLLSGLKDAIRPANIHLYFTGDIRSTIHDLKEDVKRRFPGPWS